MEKNIFVSAEKKSLKTNLIRVGSIQFYQQTFQQKNNNNNPVSTHYFSERTIFFLALNTYY